jgi:hypothetical protein
LFTNNWSWNCKQSIPQYYCNFYGVCENVQRFCPGKRTGCCIMTFCPKFLFSPGNFW